jgi:hypothetical protein
MPKFQRELYITHFLPCFASAAVNHITMSAVVHIIIGKGSLMNNDYNLSARIAPWCWKWGMARKRAWSRT